MGHSCFLFRLYVFFPQIWTLYKQMTLWGLLWILSIIDFINISKVIGIFRNWSNNCFPGIFISFYVSFIESNFLTSIITEKGLLYLVFFIVYFVHVHTNVHAYNSYKIVAVSVHIFLPIVLVLPGNTKCFEWTGKEYRTPRNALTDLGLSSL